MDGSMFAEFKVLAKHWGHPRASTKNYIVADIKELMLTLKAEGITPDIVEFLYVHQQIKTERGFEVLEHLAIDNAGGRIGPDKKEEEELPAPKVVKSNVTPITSSRKHRKNKPHIRIKTPTAGDIKWVKQGLYSAAQV